MNRRRVWARRALVAAVVALAAQQAWRHGHDYVFAENFAVIEPGRVYRGAWQQDWPMRRLVRQYRIKTIVALAHRPDSELARRERALAAEMGVRWLHIPIVEDRLDNGQRRSVADAIERATAAVADPANQPVFFHCHHGVNRASLVQIAYRTAYCGWPLDRAVDEIRRSFGLIRVEHGVDYRFMPEFYRERVLPRLQARAEGSRRK